MAGVAGSTAGTQRVRRHDRCLKGQVDHRPRRTSAGGTFTCVDGVQAEIETSANRTIGRHWFHGSLCRDLRIPNSALQCLACVTIEAAYNLALDYLYSFVDYSLKHSSELAKADFNLDRMRLLMAALGNPQDEYRIFHVAGTKGQGFCLRPGCQRVCRRLATGWASTRRRIWWTTASGFKSTAFRSHTTSSSDLVETAKPAVARIPKLTTFEITTALAFLHFANAEGRGGGHRGRAWGSVGRDQRRHARPCRSSPRSPTITWRCWATRWRRSRPKRPALSRTGIPVVSAPQKHGGPRGP